MGTNIAKRPMIVLVVLASTLIVWSQASQTRTTNPRPASSPQQAVLWAKGGEWMDVPVFPKGAQMQVMNGDPNKGAADMYIKLPSKYDTTFHWHTPIESVYVDGGQMEFSMPGSDEKKKLGSGGFFQSPAKMVHRAVCTSSEACYFYLHSAGKFDIHLVDEHGRPRAR
jgi:quercetin dioxygenase-like cupin family protein